MSQGESSSAEKSFEPTPQKLQKAREKGEVARSPDLAVTASYLGLLLAIWMFGAETVRTAGSTLMAFIDQPGRLGAGAFGDHSSAVLGGLIWQIVRAVSPLFLIPALAVVLVTLAQRAFVFAPSKLNPRLSRISLLANAKNKFGLSGMFEFAKSFTKLLLYSICLALFLKSRLPEMIIAARTDAPGVVSLMTELSLDFMVLVLFIALALGAIDAVWKHAEHLRKNRMTRKEITDEAKEAEGDPHMKHKRREKGQTIAMNQMMADVPKADVIIVNPTHYAVALKWSRLPGEAPTCVAKGVDEVALRIRETAQDASVPIYSDPPTARALHASVEIGHEIPEAEYRAVAAAIRFADEMRIRARGQI